MTVPVPAAAFAEARAAAAQVPYRPNRVERTFDLHPALHGALFAGFALYLGIMWAAFGSADLALPFVIFAVTLAGSAIVPAYWARVAGREGPKASWDEFMREGLACHTGQLDGRAVIAQVMIMPAMLVLWGAGVAVIAASV